MKPMYLLLALPLVLSACSSNEPLTKPQRCTEIQREIVSYKHPNSGYSWQMAQMKIGQLHHQAEQVGC